MIADLNRLKMKVDICEESIQQQESVHNWLKGEQAAGRTDEQDDRCIITGERLIAESCARLESFQAELAEALK